MAFNLRRCNMLSGKNIWRLVTAVAFCIFGGSLAAQPWLIGPGNPVTYIYYGANVGIGPAFSATVAPASLLHLSAPSGETITMDTPGSAQKLRLMTLVAGVPNWGAMTMNANFTTVGGLQGWYADDPTLNAWFFKLDNRGGNGGGFKNGLWLYRIPTPTNHSGDEAPVFGVTPANTWVAESLGVW